MQTVAPPAPKVAHSPSIFPHAITILIHTPLPPSAKTRVVMERRSALRGKAGTCGADAETHAEYAGLQHGNSAFRFMLFSELKTV